MLDGDLRDLVNTLRINCPMLKKIWIARSTKGKDTQKPKEYMNFVFSQMLELEFVDDLPHPGHTEQGPRKLHTVFSVNWDQQPQAQPSKKDFEENNNQAGQKLSEDYSANYSGNYPGLIPNAPIGDDESVTSSSNYPELSGISFNYQPAFNPDAYLPTDYHNTIGRHYDLSKLAREAAGKNKNCLCFLKD